MITEVDLGQVSGTSDAKISDNFMEMLLENNLPSSGRNDVPDGDLRQSFDQLMRAKNNFDTTFVTFDSALNGKPNSGPEDPKKCVCTICSNVVKL